METQLTPLSYTNFAIKHKETGRYIDAPSSVNSSLVLDETTATPDYFFSFMGDDILENTDGENIKLKTSYVVGAHNL
jgi:hypothetical protein